MPWNIVPQVFYDFLARLIPGATIIVLATLVTQGPASFVAYATENEQRIAFAPMALFLLGSYMLGLLLGQLWEMTLGRISRTIEERIEAECKGDLLTEHNRVLKALGRPELALTVADLPRAFVMHDHLRELSQGEASRLVKLQSERRLSQALVLGLASLGVANGYLILREPVVSRAVIEALLLIGAVACWARSFRLTRAFINGTCGFWLSQVSSGRLFCQPPEQE